MLLHGLEETYNDLGSGSDQDLALSTTLSVHDGVKGIVQHAHTTHFLGSCERVRRRTSKGGGEGRYDGTKPRYWVQGCIEIEMGIHLFQYP